ncbi:MAG TPA: hypothetical protein VER55_02255, partial [Ardenticatenaceae bacterium]|nr:hypothetical protein [Ardenticatenaceae bacterium]
VGLSTVLEHTAPLSAAVQPTRTAGVHVLTSGPSRSSPAELLDSPQTSAVLEQLAEQFDIVLLDTPSLVAVADAAVLAPMVDGVILIISRGHVRYEALRAVRRQLAAVHARVLGAIVNRAGPPTSYLYYRPGARRRR